MSENKRFEIKDFPYDAFLKRRIYDNLMDKIYDCTLEHQDLLCDLLNQQNDENKELKKENNKWIVDYNGLNTEYEWLKDENEQLKKLLKCSRKEANDYCEELMGKDEFIRLYKRQRDEVTEENEQLKEEFDELKRENRELNELCGKYVIKIGRLEKELKQSKKDKNCHNCKNCNTYDEGEYGFDFLCEKDCMNNDGYFDYEYHGFKKPCICPFWEDDEYD